MSPSPDALCRELHAVVGAGHVLVDPDMRASFETDWTGRFHGASRLVVRPGNTHEVAAVVRICIAHNAAIVTQGGNTGLVGGGVPRNHEVIVSTARLTRCDPVDTGASQVTVGSGVTLAAARNHARAVALDLAIDFASRDSATIGGAVATNAGGSRVIRFGTMRAQVAGIEAVLANGEVIGSLSGLPKETIGLHLPSLLCGSEGTLAIITAVRLKLVPWYRHTATALVGLPSLVAALDLLPALRRELAQLDSVELLMPSAMSLVCEHLQRTCPIPTDAGAYLLIECAGNSDQQDELMRVLALHAPTSSTAVATDETARGRLLELRDNATTAINHRGVPLKLDVALPLGVLSQTTADIETLINRLAPQSTLINFGHLAEGNLHLNTLNAGPAAEAITDQVLQMVISRGGAISAEHGIGIAKTHWLIAQRGAAEVDALRSLKASLDPHNMLNPGVLLPEAQLGGSAEEA